MSDRPKLRPRFLQAGFIDTRKAGLLGNQHVLLIIALCLAQDVNSLVYAGSKLTVMLINRADQGDDFPV